MTENTRWTPGLLDSMGRRNNRKLADKTCEACGRVYKPRTVTSRFCSRPCQWSMNGNPITKFEYWWVNQRGYIDGSIFVNGGWRRVKQHRWFMEKHIGRALSPSEDVHHINGDKADNRIENLEIVEHGHHSTHHNNSRPHKRGYKLTLSPEERKRRSDSAKHRKLWTYSSRSTRRGKKARNE